MPEAGRTRFQKLLGWKKDAYKIQLFLHFLDAVTFEAKTDFSQPGPARFVEHMINTDNVIPKISKSFFAIGTKV